MKFITLYITNHDNKAIKDLVKRKLYPNRSECIRFAIRDLIEMHNTLNRLPSKLGLHNIEEEPKNSIW